MRYKKVPYLGCNYSEFNYFCGETLFFEIPFSHLPALFPQTKKVYSTLSLYPIEENERSKIYPTASRYIFFARVGQYHQGSLELRVQT